MQSILRHRASAMLASSGFPIPMFNKHIHIVEFYTKNMFYKTWIEYKIPPSLCEDPIVSFVSKEGELEENISRALLNDLIRE